MDLISVETMKDGLIVGAAVGAVSAVAVMAIGPHLTDVSGNVAGWAGKWALISVVFGVFAAIAYGALSQQWDWGPQHFLVLAAGLAVALTAMEFLPIYGGGFAPNWQLYTVLNFVYALGFGYLIPLLH
ncbi:hypothetical protein [Methanomassiliicoccus luminyensis]|jgi:hypothetical protein|uniref:hypothetical protein n=1 Tax=Methanomassiliicoccus luminyensis TaxID=1080712 RepID=UPI0011C8F7A3|nr:hypothetical protein [Methanomassiliicoccus luminyensis]